MNKISKTIKIITVFLASPGDASDERDRVRRAVDRVNRLVAKQNGYQYEVIGWEDISSKTADRTQEVINPFVMDTDVFIGILKKRFGTPTGKAESGTEEEYELAYTRSRSENPPLEVKVYFKHLSLEDLSDPGPQLQKLLDFKSRVRESTLYHEFENIEDLGVRVENELADLIYIRRSKGHTKSEPIYRAVSPFAVQVLLVFLNGVHVSSASISSAIGASEVEINKALGILQDRGFLRLVNGANVLPNSTEAFLAISKQIFEAGRSTELLKSAYFHSMMDSRITEILQSRYHCQIDNDQAKLLRRLASVSPAITQYLLFGDTTLYDNLAKHGDEISQQEYSRKMLFNNLLHNVLYRYAGDSIRSEILDEVDNVIVQAQVVRIGINAVADSGRVYGAESVMPLVRCRASQGIDAGRLVTGDANLLVRIGTLMMSLKEWELAIHPFDQVISHNDAHSLARAAALNNKGLVLENLNRLEEAVALYKEAMQTYPEMVEPKQNLERLQRDMKSNSK